MPEELDARALIASIDQRLNEDEGSQVMAIVGFVLVRVVRVLKILVDRVEKLEKR